MVTKIYSWRNEQSEFLFYLEISRYNFEISIIKNKYNNKCRGGNRVEFNILKYSITGYKNLIKGFKSQDYIDYKKDDKYII